MRKLGAAKVLSVRLAFILALAVIIATIHIVPLLSLKNLSYAQGLENVALINSVSTGSAGQSAELSKTSSPFISTDVSTCALNKPITYLQIECMNALPILLPSFSPVPNNNVPNNISGMNNTEETFTDNSTISDTSSGSGNDSSFDNSTFGSFEGGGSSSSGSFDFSSGDISSSDGSSSSSGNHAPKADSQTIVLNESESQTFTLTGSDKDGDVLIFTNISDPAHGTLTDNVPPELTYKAKVGYTGTDSITFKVFDGIDFSRVATVDFVVNKPSLPIIGQNDTVPSPGKNNIPTADAGPDQTVNENQTVSLDGSNSKDQDSDQLAYSWKDLNSNSEIKLKNPDSAKAEFVAPAVDKTTDFKIQLTVDDGKGGKSSDDITITVVKPNREPTADAGSDQSAESGKKVKLDGSQSSDPDGDKLTFTWEQKDGPKGKINDKNSEKPTFTAPKVDKDSDVIISLTVVDKNGSKSTDDVKITVTPAASFGVGTQSDAGIKDTSSSSSDSSSKDSSSSSDSKDSSSSSDSKDSSSSSDSKDSSSSSDSKDSRSKDSSSSSDSKDSRSKDSSSSSDSKDSRSKDSSSSSDSKDSRSKDSSSSSDSKDSRSKDSSSSSDSKDSSSKDSSSSSDSKDSGGGGGN